MSIGENPSGIKLKLVEQGMTPPRDSSKQCLLADVDDLDRLQISWIPNEFAVVGKKIKLKSDNWSEWIVEEVWS